jgi:hypothetical protein
MHWFRSRIRLGARLGLFALALQIVLSFAHIHPGEFSAPATASPVVANPGHALPQAPSDRSDRDGDHLCAICALIQLAASALPAMPPPLPLPVRLAAVELQLPHVLSVASSRHAVFQARAPPSV